MKKPYSMPDILFEDFSLSSSIAAGCDRKVNGPSQGNCGFKFGDAIIYMSAQYGCTEYYGDGLYNGWCYHNPTETNKLFNS